MRKSRFSEEQIIKILKEHAAGLSASEVCRAMRTGRVLPMLLDRHTHCKPLAAVMSFLSQSNSSHYSRRWRDAWAGPARGERAPIAGLRS